MGHISEAGFGCLVISLTSAVRLHAYSLMMAGSLRGMISKQTNKTHFLACQNVEVSQRVAPSWAHPGFRVGVVGFLEISVGQDDKGDGEWQCEHGWMIARTQRDLERFRPPLHNTLCPLWMYCFCLYVRVVECECISVLWNGEWGRLPYPFVVQGQVFHVVYMQTNWGVINMSICCKVGINMFVCSIYFQLKEKNAFGVILCAKTCAQ
jgi:hypothetical protein